MQHTMNKGRAIHTRDEEDTLCAPPELVDNELMPDYKNNQNPRRDPRAPEKSWQHGWVIRWLD